MVMNVITANDKDMQAHGIAQHAEAAGMDITLFDWPRHKDRNTLIVGGDLRHVHIPSGKEPRWIKSDFRGMTKGKPRKRVFG